MSDNRWISGVIGLRLLTTSSTSSIMKCCDGKYIDTGRVRACVCDVFAIYDNNISPSLLMIIIKIIILYFIQFQIRHTDNFPPTGTPASRGNVPGRPAAELGLCCKKPQSSDNFCNCPVDFFLEFHIGGKLVKQIYMKSTLTPSRLVSKLKTIHDQMLVARNTLNTKGSALHLHLLKYHGTNAPRTEISVNQVFRLYSIGDSIKLID